MRELKDVLAILDYECSRKMGHIDDCFAALRDSLLSAEAREYYECKLTNDKRRLDGLEEVRLSLILSLGSTFNKRKEEHEG